MDQRPQLQDFILMKESLLLQERPLGLIVLNVLVVLDVGLLVEGFTNDSSGLDFT